MKKRLLLISDIHNYTQVINDLPKADILIVAGDLTSAAPWNYYYQVAQTWSVLKVLHSQKDKWGETFIHGGNHDTTLDKEYWFDDEDVISYTDREFIEVDYFADELNLSKERFSIQTTKDGLNILMIPLSSPIDNFYGKWNDPWAFHYDYEGVDEMNVKDMILKSGKKIDIISTHQPPYGYGDMLPEGRRVGSKFILELIEQLKPKLVVCGHIHEGYGTYELGQTIIVNASLMINGEDKTNEPIVMDVNF